MRIHILAAFPILAALAFAGPAVAADDGIGIVGDSTSLMPMADLQALMPCVHHIGGNGRDTNHLIEKLPGELIGKNYRIIYFNSGLWDIARRIPTPRNPWKLDPTDTADVAVDEWDYEMNLRLIVALIRGFQPNAILIFDTSTDVPRDSDGRKPRDLRRYNAIAKSVMADLGVEVDDRYAFMLPYAYLHDTRTSNKVHYLPAGSQVMAAHEVDVFQAHGGC